MSKNLWITNLLLFKIMKVFPKKSQYLCVCSEGYKNELDMKVGDVVFIKDTIKTRSYRRLGEIRAIVGKKVIVGIMGDVGVCSKLKMEKLHNEVFNEETLEEEEMEDDGILHVFDCKNWYFK